MSRFDAGRAGPSQRQLQAGEVVRRALSDALMRGETHEPGLMGASITVSEVRMTPDLRRAIAFVMPLGGQHTPELMAALGRAKGELRRHVAKSVKMKFAPELEFRLDESFDRMDETRAMLAQDAVQRDLRGEDDHDDQDRDEQDHGEED